MKMGRGDSSSPIVFYFSIYLDNSEQVCNQGPPGSGSQKSRCIKMRLNLGSGPRSQEPISVPKVDKSFYPFARTQMLGPKYLDVNMVMNVHVSTKSTVGTLEHSFKSIDEGR